MKEMQQELVMLRMNIASLQMDFTVLHSMLPPCGRGTLRMDPRRDPIGVCEIPTTLDQCRVVFRVYRHDDRLEACVHFEGTRSHLWYFRYGFIISSPTSTDPATTIKLFYSSNVLVRNQVVQGAEALLTRDQVVHYMHPTNGSLTIECGFMAH